MKNTITYWSYIIYYYITVLYGLIKYNVFKPNLTRYNEYVMRFKVLRYHHRVRQRYDKKYPYYYHLNMVMGFSKQFSYCVPGNELDAFKVAAGHDLIEDVHFLTYNDVRAEFGTEVADGIYACTKLRGKNRKERHGPEYYHTLNVSLIGKHAKICDVMANMTQGVMTGSSMLNKYRKEYPDFRQKLYQKQFDPMFKYIEQFLFIKQ